MPQRVVTVFQEFGDREARDYLTRKVQALVGPQRTGAQLENYVDVLLGATRVEDPPLANAKDFPHLDEARQTEVDRAIRCMREQVSRLSPLVDGETVEDDLATYLVDDWGAFAAGTPVLRRRTNLSSLLYLYADLRIRDDRIVYPPMTREALFAEPSLASMDAALPDWGAGARALASGLTGQLPSPMNVLGAALLAALFPNGKSTNWEQIYQALRQIVREELDQQMLDNTMAKVAGITDFLSTEYRHLKADKRTSRTQLQQALAPYDHDFYTNVVNVFMADRYRLAGAANFGIAAGLHLGVLQERALVDPGHSDPRQSPYAAAVRDRAKQFVDHARTIAPLIVAKRIRRVTAVKEDQSTHCHGGSAPVCTTNYWYWFEDPGAKYKSKEYSYNSAQKDPPDSEGDATRARTKYLANLTSAMNQNVADNLPSALWEKLIADPIPDPVQ